jgi:hypothetical protein
MAEIDRSLAQALVPHQDAIERLCEIPGIGVRTAQHIVAETGPRAEVFDSAGKLASWAGMCPGQQESAGVSVSSRSAKGKWMLRRTLCQTAWAAIATKGSDAQRCFNAGVLGCERKRLPGRSRITRYASYGKFSTMQFDIAVPISKVMAQRALLARAKRAINDLRRLGYAVSITPPETQTAGALGLPG